MIPPFYFSIKLIKCQAEVMDFMITYPIYNINIYNFPSAIDKLTVMCYNIDMSIQKQHSADPKEKLEYLKKQLRLTELSISSIEYGITNPPPPIDHEKICRELELIPHIGEYREGAYYYYTPEELQKRK